MQSAKNTENQQYPSWTTKDKMHKHKMFSIFIHVEENPAPASEP